MAFKPILLNTAMVRAILNGTKTQTRRICKGQSQDGITSPEALGYEPPYHVGDILWVRETWNVNNLRDDGDDCQAGFIYKASEPPDYGFRWAMVTWGKYEKYEQSMSTYFEGWRPSIHMPKEAARLFLRVKSVRIERLQDITPAGVEAEGTDMDDWYEYDEWQHQTGDGLAADGISVIFETMRGFFGHTVWDATMQSQDQYEKFGWDANPWVWVIEFERIDRKDVGAWP